MLCISLDSTDPCFNLAVDEYLLKNSREEFFILGINDRCVVIGKHQAAHRESNTKYVYENEIPVLRRISGGGTVYHDRGNLNYSVIVNSEAGKQVNFFRYTKPVIDFLSSLGVNALFGGRNDLLVDGMKISGNAEHVYHERVLHHGTMLFDSDLHMLNNSLRGDKRKYCTRAVSSNPSPVINLKHVIKNNVLKTVLKYGESIEDFKSLMVSWFMENIPGSLLYGLTPAESAEIEKLAGSRYRRWEWNYAYGPDYIFDNSFIFEGVSCSCRLDVQGGIIKRCETVGSLKLETLPGRMEGCRHMPGDMNRILTETGLSGEGFDLFWLF